MTNITRLGEDVARTLPPMIRAELPFGLTEILVAAGPGVSLERTLGQSLRGMAAEHVLNLATGVKVTLPGTGMGTSAALTAHAGTWELVPLGRRAPAWQDLALGPVRISTMNPGRGAVPGSNLETLRGDIFAVVGDGLAVRPAAHR